MADPGDFTRRAWKNGKIEDLTQLEAIADLIHSETTEQRKQAMSQMRGELGVVFERWTKQLHHCLAYYEAAIDFGEDQHLEEDILGSGTFTALLFLLIAVYPRIDALISDMRHHLNDSKRGEALRNGLVVCLAGKPNAGKSSLLNLIARRKVSIVSPEAGTTRDVVETRMDLGGYPLILQDTAGLHDSPHIGAVEKEGMLLARENFAAADLRIVLLDVSDLKEEDANLSTLFGDHSLDSTVVVFNKMDQFTALPVWAEPLKAHPHVFVSCKTGDGIDAFLEELHKQVKHL